MMIGLRSDPEATLFLRCSVVLFGAWYPGNVPPGRLLYAAPMVYREAPRVILYCGVTQVPAGRAGARVTAACGRSGPKRNHTPKAATRSQRLFDSESRTETA
ncbi:hypothetical protein GCM10020227_10680 [Streptomyces flavovirens]